MAWGGAQNKHVAPRGRIWLARLGGLSPVRQNNQKAPTKSGFWAFLWPYIEPFLVGSTDDRGPVHSKWTKFRKEHPGESGLDAEGNVLPHLRDRPSRYELNKRKVMPLR